MSLDYGAVRATSAQWSPVSFILEDKSWQRSAQRKLAELSKLPENWNSYGSPPVQQGALELAANLIPELVKLDMPEPEIFPVSGGGIQLEWKNSERELEIEVRSNKTIEFLLVEDDGEMYESHLPQNNTPFEITTLIQWFKTGKISPNQLMSIYALT
jgi:hypothetical protein